MLYKEYSNPDGVGWKGWLETLDGSCLGFVGLNGIVTWMWDLKF